jgi:hypothetical protein
MFLFLSITHQKLSDKASFFYPFSIATVGRVGLSLDSGS